MQCITGIPKIICYFLSLGSCSPAFVNKAPKGKKDNAIFAAGNATEGFNSFRIRLSFTTHSSANFA